MQSGVTFSIDPWILLFIALGIFLVFTALGISLALRESIAMRVIPWFMFIGVVFALGSVPVASMLGLTTNINTSIVQKGYGVSDIKADGPSGSRIVSNSRTSLHMADKDGNETKVNPIGAASDGSGRTMTITQNIPVSFRDANGGTESGMLGMTGDYHVYLLMKGSDGSFVDYAKYVKDGGAKAGVNDKTKTKAKTDTASPATKGPDYDYTHGVAYGGTR